VWEFHNNLSSLEGWKNVARETHFKGLSYQASQRESYETYRFCPLFKCSPTADSDVIAFTPVNANRDIYLPICLDGQRFVLALQEDDPKLAEKEKELYWILYTQAAKERPITRFFYWLLVTVAVLLVGINVVKNILLVVL
jgi:hypothetical protein